MCTKEISGLVAYGILPRGFIPGTDARACLEGKGRPSIRKGNQDAPEYQKHVVDSFLAWTSELKLHVYHAGRGAVLLL